MKSFFGSNGVVAEHVSGKSDNERANRLYAMLNRPIVTEGILSGACERYGYLPDQIEMRLYVGKFAGGTKVNHEQLVRDWCAEQTIGSGPIGVYSVGDIAKRARAVASSKTYRDNPGLVAIKVLESAGMLTTMDG